MRGEGKLPSAGTFRFQKGYEMIKEWLLPVSLFITHEQVLTENLFTMKLGSMLHTGHMAVMQRLRAYPSCFKSFTLW